MKILVTGVAGFIGSWLAGELRKQEDWSVVGIDRQQGDLSVPGVIDGLLDLHAPSIVVHLAAQASVLYCEENPLKAIQNNVGMTMLVAKACAQRGLKLIYSSSSEVYGDQMDRGECVEDGPIGSPRNIYALTKLWGEQVCRLYVPRRDLLVLRLSMPFGPLQETSTSPRLPRHRAAVVNFLWQGLHRQPMPVHTGSERSLVWIGDLVRAIRMLIEQNRTGTWNVGRDDQRMPVYNIAKIACKLTGAPTSLIQLMEPPGYRTQVKNLSMAKIRATGWKPEVSLEEAMKRTLEWVKTLPSPDVKDVAFPLPIERVHSILLSLLGLSR